MDIINEAIVAARRPEEAERGLMAFYTGQDGLNDKISSLVVHVEVHGGMLWVAADVETTVTLPPGEIDVLCWLLADAYTKDFHENLEHRKMIVPEGELLVHLCYPGEGIFLITEQGLRQRLGLDAVELSDTAIFPEVDTVMLKQRLFDRLRDSFMEYTDSIRRIEEPDRMATYVRTAAIAEAYVYLTHEHNFSNSELAYLLIFQNPLEVVADSFMFDSDLDRSDIMSKILGNEDGRMDNYPTMFEPRQEATMKEEHSGEFDAPVERPLIEQYLYSPISCEFGSYGEYDEWQMYEIDRYEAVDYEEEIRAALIKEHDHPEEAERGLMAYFDDEVHSVEEKVHSLFVDVEIHGDRLWAVAKYTTTEPLTSEDLHVLKEYLTGQYSDGFGEGFEQHEIKVQDGELYVHLWQSDGGFFMDTEEEFAKRFGFKHLFPLPGEQVGTVSSEHVTTDLPKLSLEERKQSVLARLRETEKSPIEVRAKDNPAKKKSDPEL